MTEEPWFPKLKAVLDQIEYAPGYHIIMTEHPFGDSFFIEVGTWTEDAYNPGKQTYVKVQEVAHHRLFIDWEVNEERFLYFVHHMCAKLALHEVDEWFKVRGERFRNMHPPVPPYSPN